MQLLHPPRLRFFLPQATKTTIATSLLIGPHPPDNGGIHMALRRAASANANAVQLFTARPQFYNDKIGVRPERLQRFREAVAETGFDLSACLVHAAYVLNTATPDMDKYERSCAALARELERCSAFGVMGFCFHPGSAGTSDVDSAIDRAGDAIAGALAAHQGPARVLIENTAGGGRTMGRSPEEVAAMLARISPEERRRTGYGLDTCHLFVSGYDLTAGRAEVRDILDRFCDATGEAPSFMHLNDSEGELGSNRDRHALLGEGRLGLEPFRWLLEDSRLRGIPLIVETPTANPAIGDDDPSADEFDAKMVSLVRELAGVAAD
ncbi:MAG: deoxyribonuclease IV [Gemmatimonadota bacterium]